MMSNRWVRPVALALGLSLLLGANFLLRSTLEEAPRHLYSFLEVYYGPQLPILFEQTPAWRLLLPLQELTGAWAATTLILTYLVERVVGPAGAWYLFNALAMVVAFTTSLALFRSAVFSFTFALAVGFGTHFYHAYAVAGGIASYLMLSYNILLLFAFTQLVRGVPPRWIWIALFVASVALNVLGYEGWLDALVLVWVAGPFVYVGLRRMNRPVESARLVWLTLLLTAIGVLYVVVKVRMGFGQVAGSESDVIFNYTSLWPIADDFASNVLTHAYMSFSNFFPPALVGASAFYRLGPEALVAAQHGYHEPFSYLVPMHQVFFWRYYAGAAFVFLLGALWMTMTRVWRRPSAWSLALAVFLLMILVGGPTHSAIKFRPMNSMPVMGYHVTVGVIGMSLLLSWLVTTAWRDWTNRRGAAVVVVAVWAMIGYSALARPPYLSHMAAQAGLGEFLYPNPLKTLIERLGGSYVPPKGLALYRLAPFKADEGLAVLRSQLSDLPGRLPPVTDWAAVGVDTQVTPLPDGGLEVVGDTTEFGYQMMSPPIQLRPGQPYLVRVKYEAREGRVCAGVLSGDQQRWVVAPDGTSAEYAFNSQALDAVRVVIANCYRPDADHPRSQFRLHGGSYATISAQ